MNPVLAIVLVCVSLHSVNGQGVAYTRWGRTTCPPGTYALYKGYMAGTWYGHGGGGSDYLCLHESPTTSSRLNPSIEGSTSYLYGVEYQFLGQYSKDRQPFSFANNFGANLHDNDAPCVVCYQPNRSVMIVIPGRDDCGASDLTPEYTGFIVTQYLGYGGKTQHICLDEAPEAISGGNANRDGQLMYPVQIHQGSMACPPYVHGNEVPCAVCTI